MTGKADFTAEEWELVLEGPPAAAMLVIVSDRGGSIRETYSMAKVYAEARAHHGESELLDAIASAKPEMDHTRYHSIEEMKEHSLKHISDGVSLLESKATPQEVDDYRQFISNLADKVANARKEGFMGLTGDRVSEGETAALAEIAEALGASST